MKKAQEIIRRSHRLLTSWSRTQNHHVVYTSNSLEFIKSCKYVIWNHGRSTPHKTETNGTAKGALRRIKEGTSSVLVQSSLHASWWREATECLRYLRNTQELLADGTTLHERRFDTSIRRTDHSIWCRNILPLYSDKRKEQMLRSTGPPWICHQRH